ncbi:MAG: IS1634 family transposase [Proteobacteria bacterium]|nr:IS1634 family transposase [Pseudomonadota bacterium]
MYLRTTKRQNKDGSVVEYYQLAHNFRHPETNKPVARIIHNFGRADQLDRQSLVRLCHSIARVCGIEFPESLVTAASTPEVSRLPSDLKLIRTRELGSVWAIEALWERLGLGPTLRQALAQQKGRGPYERALLAMTANRLCEPESKLGVWDRWLSRVYLPSCRGLKLPQMYEAMDFLHGQAEEVERAVFFRTAHLFNLEVDLIFYDTTTAAFAIDAEDEEGQGLRCFGRPKNGVWAPQVVVALAVTREGLPVRSWVFPGNTTDVKTVEKVKADLRGWQLGRALFVADAGMNSQDNRQLLAKACGKYLLAVRLGSVTEVKTEVLTRPGRYQKIADNLYAKEVVVGDGERRRRYILCFNPLEAKRQRRHRQQVIQELAEELSRHAANRATARWAINLQAAGRYKRYLLVDDQGGLQLNRQAVREAQKSDGKWVLITNDDTISIEDAASGYKGLLVIERCFRTLKSTQIKLEPMHHWLPHRIEAHIKICVFALLLERVAEMTCQKPWSAIKNHLSTLQVSEFQTSNQTFCQRNEIPPKLLKILKTLEIPPPKLVLEVSSAPSKP